MTGEPDNDLFTEVAAELAERAPGNEATFPLSITHEQRPDGFIWWVAITIQQPGKNDIVIDVEDEDWARALRKARVQLRQLDRLQSQADKQAAMFKLTPIN